MSRSRAERVSDVRRLLEAARRVYARRAELVPELVATTGLSAQGVELGFESLEREATDEQLEALVDAAGDAAHVHVVLSANVFVAPLRALALARAAAPRVTVRPSPRDPVVTRALVAEASGEGVAILDERDAARTGADAVHVYGRDETIAAVAAGAPPGTTVTGHGAGLGIAVVSPDADEPRAAQQLALDVVAFDQRGCLSPRLALVVGDEARASRFAGRLHLALEELDRRVPRGTLHPDEREAAVRWMETLAFSGRLWRSAEHAVGVDGGDGLALPPPGRHLLVLAVADPAAPAARIAPLEGAVVTVGADDEPLARRIAPAHARIARLGAMQRPALDGPVDRRSLRAVPRPLGPR